MERHLQVGINVLEAAFKARDHSVIEVRVGLETKLHTWDVRERLRASALRRWRSALTGCAAIAFFSH